MGKLAGATPESRRGEQGVCRTWRADAQRPWRHQVCRAIAVFRSEPTRDESQREFAAASANISARSRAHLPGTRRLTGGGLRHGATPAAQAETGVSLAAR